MLFAWYRWFFLIRNIDRTIITKFGLALISLLSRTQLISNHQKAAPLRSLTQLHTNFQLIPVRGFRSTDRSLFTRIIANNYKVFCPIRPKFGTYICLWLPYMCAKFQLDRSMHSRVVWCLSKENMKNKHWNFAHLYLGKGWCDLL